ncbi:MAG: hypothetical protein P9X24_14650 [Candidatus Hatepunaea meridiana]|nr:hypothetical protein [Candidatus Hatepunaea meridiana]
MKQDSPIHTSKHMYFLLTIIALLVILLTVLLTDRAFAQDDGGGDYIEIEEVIRIQVDPEMPNVLTTIPRQEPKITVGQLKRPENSKIVNSPISIKPRLTDIKISKIEKPKKMLAKVREQ